MLDLLAGEFTPGEAIHGPIEIRPGGSPVNATLAAVAEGATAAVVGRVGDDPVGRMLREALADVGVEPLLAVDPELPTGTFLAAGGAVAADPGANARLTTADLPERLAAEVLIVSPYAPPEVALAAVARADAAWILAGAPGANACIVHGAEDDLPEVATRFRLAVVTLGAAGELAALDGAVRLRPERVVSEPVVGAGDAFAASLLLALAGGSRLEPPERVRLVEPDERAGAVAELVVEVERDQLRRLLHRHSAPGDAADRVAAFRHIVEPELREAAHRAQRYLRAGSRTLPRACRRSGSRARGRRPRRAARARREARRIAARRRRAAGARRGRS